MPGSLAMAAPTTLHALLDLDGLPYPDLPHELWRGELRRVMPAGGAHGTAVSRILVALGRHVYDHDLGELFSESTGFVLERDPDTVLCPDVAFVARERLRRGAPGLAFDADNPTSPFPEIAPDLAVEVLSPGNRPGEIRAKVEAYLRFGVRAVWVLQPAARKLRVHTRTAAGGQAAAVTTLGEHQELTGGEILPGFRCRVSDLLPPLSR